MASLSSKPPGLSGQALTSVIPPALYAGAAANAVEENARATAYFANHPLPTHIDLGQNAEAWGHILLAGPEMLHRVVLSEAPSATHALPYLTVPTDARSPFATELAYLEAFQMYFDTVLRHQSFSDYTALKSLEIMIGHVQSVISDVADNIDHQGRHPRVLIESVLSQFQGRNKTAYLVRVEPNMGDGNKVDNHDGRFGTGLKEATYGWLCEKFGHENVFVDPVGTAFYARVSDPDALENMFNAYPFGVKMLLAEDHGKRAGKQAVSAFVPHVAVYFHEINAASLVHKNHAKGLEGALVEELRWMSAAIHYFKKIHLGDKKHVYSSDDLGVDAQQCVADLARRGVNFVGFEPYRPDPSMPIESLKARKSLLTQPLSKGGGLLELLEQARLGLSLAWSTQALSNDNAFSDLSALIGVSALNAPGANDGAAAPVSLGEVIRFGLESLRDPRNPSLIKADPVLFAQEVLRKRNKRLIVSEVDFGKAFLEAYPPQTKDDQMDSDFQYTRQVWLDVAHEMGLVDEHGNPDVIICAIEGDQIIVSCGDGFLSDGRHVDLRDYVSRVHQRVKERFADRQFQATHKVHDPVTGVQTRTPVWYHSGENRHVLSLTHPGEGFESVMTQLTISSAYGSSPLHFGFAENETHPDQIWKTFVIWAQAIDAEIKYQGKWVQIGDERVAVEKGASAWMSVAQT